jgi:hypothetical protein
MLLQLADSLDSLLRNSRRHFTTRRLFTPPSLQVADNLAYEIVGMSFRDLNHLNLACFDWTVTDVD